MFISCHSEGVCPSVLWVIISCISSSHLDVCLKENMKVSDKIMVV